MMSMGWVYSWILLVGLNNRVVKHVRLLGAPLSLLICKLPNASRLWYNV